MHKGKKYTGNYKLLFAINLSICFNIYVVFGLVKPSLKSLILGSFLFVQGFKVNSLSGLSEHLTADTHWLCVTSVIVSIIRYEPPLRTVEILNHQIRSICSVLFFKFGICCCIVGDMCWLPKVWPRSPCVYNTVRKHDMHLIDKLFWTIKYHI